MSVSIIELNGVTFSLMILSWVVMSLTFGSFAGMLVYRLIDDKPLFSMVKGDVHDDNRSYCPSCMKNLAWYHNIPVFSYIMLNGKCAFCKERISWHYPAIELITLILFTTTLYFRYSHGIIDVISSIAVVYALIIISFTDIMSGYIFDKITFPFIAFGLTISPWTIGFIPAAGSAAAGYTSLWLLNAAHKKLRGIDGMGYGDFKLFAMIGAFTGPFGMLVSAMIGPILSIFVITVLRVVGAIKDIRSVQFTFGQYLAIGSVPPILWGGKESFVFIQSFIQGLS